jgi:L,D-peptidoglycan transpeptidase YkuD (ErfK/YbiS/YcfS/YnhG family)
MGWCDDKKDKKNYNKLIKIRKKIKHEKLYRKDSKYDFLIPIMYNTKKIIPGKGSAIFIHLTKDYKNTLGCIALNKNDFLILLKLIDRKSKLKIN